MLSLLYIHTSHSVHTVLVSGIDRRIPGFGPVIHIRKI